MVCIKMRIDKPIKAERTSGKKPSRYIKKTTRKNVSKWSTLSRCGGDEDVNR
jgi:hypothetical protein